MRDAIRSASSPKRAVRPPTYASASLPSSAAGMVSARSRSTSARVRSSCGPCSGVTVITAASPAVVEDRLGDARDLTVGAHALRRARASGASPPGSETATTSGPLTPGAEAGGEPVVGLALGRVGAEVAVVGLAELEAGGGRGERGGDERAGGEREPRAARRPRPPRALRRSPARPHDAAPRPHGARAAAASAARTRRTARAAGPRT